MKSLTCLFLLLTFGIFNAQSADSLQNLTHDNEVFKGLINNDTKISVKIDSIKTSENQPEEFLAFGSSDVEGTICRFEGIIKPNHELTQNFVNMGMIFYHFEFKEKRSHEHTGIFTGSLNMKKITGNRYLSVFEGFWENYNKTMKYHVFFDNSYILDHSTAKSNNELK